MKKLGEILIEKKILSPQDLEQLLQKQKVTKEKLGDLVVKSGFISSEDLMKIVAEQYGLQYMNIREIVLPVSLQKEFNFEVLKNYRIVPLKVDDKKVFIGINNVNILKDLDDISFNLGKNVVPVLLSEVAVDKMLDDLEKLPFGSKDYLYKSIETIVDGKSDVDKLVKSILDYDSYIERIFIKEDAPPFIKKINLIEKVPTEPLSKAQILNAIKNMCDENERKLLVNNGFISIKKNLDNKMLTINIYKEGNSFFILVINHRSTAKNLLDYKLDKNLIKYLLEPSRWIIFLIAPFGHGKATFFSSIIEYFNANKNQNILYITDRLDDSLVNQNSNIVQIERSTVDDSMIFNKILNDIDPTLLFINNLDSTKMLHYLYRFVESGRSAYVSIESSCIQSSIEGLLYKEPEVSLKYHLNRIADNTKLFMNFRLINDSKGHTKHFIYEYCLNNFKIKKAIRENILNIISSQIRGTGDYIPFELQMGELFTKGLISYDTAESFAQDFELFKRYAKING
ncbi:MAG: hypothetical protein LDL13_02530 [Calditerrivibrio sp.]|nr:hypothetical protein [Calditerrivibrio sp.]